MDGKRLWHEWFYSQERRVSISVSLIGIAWGQSSLKDHLQVVCEDCGFLLGTLMTLLSVLDRRNTTIQSLAPISQQLQVYVTFGPILPLSEPLFLSAAAAFIYSPVP